MRKNINAIIGSYKHQLVICNKSHEYYQPMKYYVVIRYCDIFHNDRLRGFGDGYFIKYENHYDFFPIDEFNSVFTVVDDCEQNEKIGGIISWLRNTKAIKITIVPDIKDDGYWFDYSFWISYPFHVKDEEENGFGNFELAAKKAIELAKKACVQVHGKSGGEWLKYVITR